jgi:hypothetical protein
MFRPKREEVTKDWRKLHTGELHDLYIPNNRVIKLRRMRWIGHLACIERTGIWHMVVKIKGSRLNWNK